MNKYVAYENGYWRQLLLNQYLLGQVLDKIIFMMEVTFRMKPRQVPYIEYEKYGHFISLLK